MEVIVRKTEKTGKNGNKRSKNRSQTVNKPWITVETVWARLVRSNAINSERKSCTTGYIACRERTPRECDYSGRLAQFARKDFWRIRGRLREKLRCICRRAQHRWASQQWHRGALRYGGLRVAAKRHPHPALSQEGEGSTRCYAASGPCGDRRLNRPKISCCVSPRFFG